MSNIEQQHKADVLKTAGDYFEGRAGNAETSKHLHDIFAQAMMDGTASELFKDLQKTPMGNPNVFEYSREGKEVLHITPAFTEQHVVKGTASLSIVTDQNAKSADVLFIYSGGTPG